MNFYQSNYPQGYSNYPVSSGPPPPPGMDSAYPSQYNQYGAYTNTGPYGWNAGQITPAVQMCHQQSYNMGQQAPPQVPMPQSYNYSHNIQGQYQMEMQMQRMIYDQMGYQTPEPVKVATVDGGRVKVVAKEKEERASPEPLPDRKKIDDGVKERMRNLFVDELMRRYMLSGTLEMTTGTVKPLAMYPADDPVVQFFMKTGENITDKPWDVEADCAYLRASMKGLGTVEDMINHIACTRSNQQRQEMKKQFKAQYGRDLIEDFKSELSGDYKSAILACFVSPAYYDAYCIHEAIDGIGTDEDALIEILMTRTNDQIQEIRDTYGLVRSSKKRANETDLEKDIKGDTSGHFKKLLLSACQGRRRMFTRANIEAAVEEIKNLNGDGTGMFEINYNKLVDMDKAKREARRLFEAGEDKWGTNEETFNLIFSLRDFYHLRVVYQEYVKLTQHSIVNAVKSETSGDLKSGLKAIIACVQNRPMFFAERLLSSMKGLGTDEKTLIRIVASRSEIDMVQIKAEFLKLTNKTLWRYIGEDTSFNFKKVLQALVGRD